MLIKAALLKSVHHGLYYYIFFNTYHLSVLAVSSVEPQNFTPLMFAVKSSAPPASRVWTRFDCKVISERCSAETPLQQQLTVKGAANNHFDSQKCNECTVDLVILIQDYYYYDSTILRYKVQQYMRSLPKKDVFNRQNMNSFIAGLIVFDCAKLGGNSQ